MLAFVRYTTTHYAKIGTVTISDGFQRKTQHYKNTKMNTYFFAKQAIFKKDRSVFGYEVLFRKSGNEPLMSIPDNATDSIISGSLALSPVTRIDTQKYWFFNFCEQDMLNRTYRILPKQKVCLEVLDTTVPSKALVQEIKAAKALGYRIAFDDFSPENPWRKYLPLADIIKFDLTKSDLDYIETVMSVCDHPCLYLAEKVETEEEFNQCVDIGMDLFQGYYLERPQLQESDNLSPRQSTLFNILEKVNCKNANKHQIENEIKKDVSTYISIIKMANDISIKVSKPIVNIKHAINYLGLYKIQVLVSTIISSELCSNEYLYDKAINRAKMFEFLCRKSNNREMTQCGFFIGLITILDEITHNNGQRIIDSINLEPRVREQIKHRKGELGEVLSLVELLESSGTYLEELPTNITDTTVDDVQAMYNRIYI